MLSLDHPDVRDASTERCSRLCTVQLELRLPQSDFTLIDPTPRPGNPLALGSDLRVFDLVVEEHELPVVGLGGKQISLCLCDAERVLGRVDEEQVRPLSNPLVLSDRHGLDHSCHLSVHQGAPERLRLPSCADANPKSVQLDLCAEYGLRDIGRELTAAGGLGKVYTLCDFTSPLSVGRIGGRGSAQSPPNPGAQATQNNQYSHQAQSAPGKAHCHPRRACVRQPGGSAK